MRRRHRDRPIARATIAAVPLVAVALALSACVTTVLDEDPEFEQPSHESIVIPLPTVSPTGGHVDVYYRSILGQMQQAVIERDLLRLRGLIVSHDDERAPAWARARIADFRDLVKALQFEARASELSSVYLASGDHPLGAVLEFTFRMRRAPDTEVLLGGERSDFPASILVSIEAEDRDALGSRSTRSTSELLRPTRTVDLRREPLVLPFRLGLHHGGAAVRTVTIRAELLPGRVTVDGIGVPNQRVLLAEYRNEFFPEGVEPIRAEPLKTMRNALQLGDPKHFPHVFLAARFMPEDDREAAIDLLIERLRLGRADQGRCAMAALQTLTGAEISVADRDGWLRWQRER